MLVDIYGATELKSLERIVGKREGQEVELVFEALNSTITFNFSKSRLTPQMGKSDRAVTTVILSMKKEELLPSFNSFIRTKDNLWGMLKLFLKYLIPRKIKVKGSLGGGITLIRLLFIGKHSMYKKK